MAVSAREATLSIPDADWSVVRGRLNQYWEAKNAPHISVMAQTRAGKSYLVRHGIAPLCKWDRVLIIDVKGGRDSTLAGFGKPVRHIPSKFHSAKQLLRDKQPMENWFRLVTYDNINDARSQVHEAFERIYAEGDWVLIIDELRAVTDPQPPGLRLRADWERFILRGGSQGIATVNLSQEPRWCPGSFYTQSNFYFFSRIEDEASHKRVAEVGSAKALIPHLQNVRRRHWIYMDNMEDSGDRFWCKTIVKKEGR